STMQQTAAAIPRRNSTSKGGRSAAANFMKLSLTTKKPVASTIPAMPRKSERGESMRARAAGGRRVRSVNPRPRSSQASAGSAAGHAHMAADGRLARAPVDDEVVALGLSRNRPVDRGIEQVVGLRSAQ